MDFAQLQLLSVKDKTGILRQHNFHVIQELGRDLYARSANFNSYIQHLRERNQRQAKKVQKLIEALNIVHYRKDEPIETLRKLMGGGRL
jgi:DNA anti-recombination protein RmuC